MKKFDKILLGILNLSFFLLACISATAFLARALPEIKIKIFPMVMAIVMLIAAIKWAFDNFPLDKDEEEK